MVEQNDVYDTIQALFGGAPVGYSHRGAERDPIAIRVGLPKRDLGSLLRAILHPDRVRSIGTRDWACVSL